MDSASHGELRMTSAALISPSATLRLRSARASRTALARCRAWRCCGPGDILASASIGSSLFPLPSEGELLVVSMGSDSEHDQGPHRGLDQRGPNVPDDPCRTLSGPLPERLADAG